MTLAREIALQARSAVRYSICTLVTKPNEYSALQQSFLEAGFREDICEFLYIDNSEVNQCDAFAAVNRFLQEARGQFVILCHQDIRLHDDRIDDMERVIAQVTQLDPQWGVLGNAGGVAPGQLAIRITDPKGVNTANGPFPTHVDALDENFMIVRRAANLGVSGDLAGFHFYGTDLCIIADILGYRSYVIDFHLHHLGGESTNKGKTKNSFHSSYPKIRRALTQKYRRAFRPRWIQNTGTILYLSGSRFRHWLLNGRTAVNLAKSIGRARTRLKNRLLPPERTSADSSVDSSVESPVGHVFGRGVRRAPHFSASTTDSANASTNVARSEN
ncbi:MAG: hypothetical protein RIK87_11270 [Fuerstiella sp.]